MVKCGLGIVTLSVTLVGFATGQGKADFIGEPARWIQISAC